jgi:hypothetical protein
MITATGGNITAALQAGSIQTGHLAAQAVTADRIAANTITAAQIASGTITAAQIAAGSITADRLDVNTLSAISADIGNISAGTISGVTAFFGPVTLSGTGLAMSTAAGNGLHWDNGATIYSTSGPSIILNASGLGSSVSIGSSLLDVTASCYINSFLTVGSLAGGGSGALVGCDTNGKLEINTAVQSTLSDHESRLAALEGA